MRTWRRRGEDEQFEYLPSKYIFGCQQEVAYFEYVERKR
jgi:hypothetical protein